MKAKEIRQKSPDELKEQMAVLYKQQMDLRFQKAGGNLDNPAQMKYIRRDLARIKTILLEKTRSGDIGKPSKETSKNAKKTAKKTDKAKKK